MSAARMDDNTAPEYRSRHQSNDDDSDNEGVDFDFEFGPRRQESANQEEQDVIDVERLEAEYDAAIDLTGDDDDDNGSPFRRAQSAPFQSGQVFGICGRQFDEFICNDGLVIRAGMTVELSEPITIVGLAAPFLKITAILGDGAGGATVRGIPFARARHVKRMLARKMNEVCMLVVVDNTQLEAQHEVPVDRVVKVRELRMTNAAHPEYRFEDKDYTRRGKHWVLANGPLVCRWKFVQIFDACLARKKNAKPVEWELVKIQEEQADTKYRERAEFLVNKWRGGIVPGGSFKASGSEVPVVDLNSPTTRGQRQQSRRVPLSPGQQYTAGDTFAGAGGASRGIELAGARLIFAVDHWDAAAKSLRANFSEDKTKVHEVDIHEFVTDEAINYRVDLLHLSPPCQVWSPAHTTPGQNDETNEASLWSCTHIVKKVRPRLFTVEQTFGILAPRFQPHFGLFIAGFTDLGYSIRWKVINLKTFGLAQPRRRVIIFGAGPGEKLPPFPAPTHSERGARDGLKPLTTVQHALRRVGRGGHDPLHSPKPFNSPRASWNPNSLLPNTMTCGGGQNYHWSGKRDFTLREYALLQGFPIFHRFEAPHVKKQIGNAFPPSVVKIIYKHLIAWLDKTDGTDSSSRQPNDLATLFGPQAAGARAIELDDGAQDDDEVEFIRAERRKRARAGQSGGSRPKRVAYVSLVDDEEEDAGYQSSTSSMTLGRSLASRGSSLSSRGVTPARPRVGSEVAGLRGGMEQLSVVAEGTVEHPIVL